MRIVFFGDSITDANRDREEKVELLSYGGGFVRAVAGVLKSKNPTGYTVFNRGISENRVTNLYARIERDVWHLKPDLVSVLVGVNDIWSVEIERYERMYRMLIEDTKAHLPSVKMMLCEPFIFAGEKTKDNFGKFSEVKEYAKVVKRLAEEYGLPFVPLQERLSAAVEEFGVEHFVPDGIHPSVAGAQLIAEEWLKAFEKISDC